MKKIPCVNAAHTAFIYDKNNKLIGYCMDTPNNCAYAFVIFKTAVKIVCPFNKPYTKDVNMLNRMEWIMNDEIYHKKYIQVIE